MKLVLTAAGCPRNTAIGAARLPLRERPWGAASYDGTQTKGILSISFQKYFALIERAKKTRRALHQINPAVQ